MPRLVKGGKFVFGWSRVGEDGRIIVPPEAIEEYGLEDVERVILLSGSKKSGGFRLTTVELLQGTTIGTVLDENPRLARFESPEGEAERIKAKTYCWVGMEKNGVFSVPLETLKKYSIEPGDMLLVVR